MSWRIFVLFLHILAAMAAFGPPMAYGLIATLGTKELAHANFALRIIHRIESRLAAPMAVVVPILGVILIVLGDWVFFENEWLLISVALYAIAFFFAIFGVDRWLGRMIEMTGGQSGSERLQAGEQADQGTEFLALAKKTRVGGTFLAVVVVVILLLMVWKPGACQIGPCS
jgi:Predicted integral membrane protein (DUF2269)